MNSYLGIVSLSPLEKALFLPTISLKLQKIRCHTYFKSIEMDFFQGGVEGKRE
jgi:hypothetical protein